MSRIYWLSIVVAVGLTFPWPVEGKGVARHSSSHTATVQSNGKPQDDAPLTISATIQDNIKRIANALEIANEKQPSQYDRRNAEAQERVAWWTPWIARIATLEMLITAAGVFLVYRTLLHTRRAADAAGESVEEAKRAANEARRQADAAESSVLETRKVGEAQVRAYVNIVMANVLLVRQANNQIHPVVTIQANNTGQSPAINFVWNPTVQYINGLSFRQRELGGNWREIVGVDIPTNDPFSGSALVPDMAVDEFLSSTNLPETATMLVRLRIQFEFQDVFEHRVVNEAYFAGVLAKHPIGRVTNTSFGPAAWNGTLHRLHRLSDWENASVPNTDLAQAAQSRDEGAQ